MISQSRIDKIIFGGIIALLIFAPLAFGAVHVWAYSVIQLGVLLLLALWFVDRLIVSNTSTLTWVKTPVNLMMIILVGFILFQIIPLPPFLLALLSPKTFADKIGRSEHSDRCAGCRIPGCPVDADCLQHSADDERSCSS